MIHKNLKNLSVSFKELLIFSYVIFFIYKLYLYVRTTNNLYQYINGWAFSESLIDYSGGFVRRGLLGETLSLFTSNLKIFVILNFLIFVISLVHILYHIFFKISDYSIETQLLIYLCPFGLMFLIENLNYIFGRRDLLILNLLIYVTRRKEYSILNIFTFFIISILITLTYELFILYLPIFWLLIKVDNTKLKKFKFTSFFLILFINTLLLTLFFSSKNFKLLCENIDLKRQILKLEEAGCWGGPNYLSNQNKNYFAEIVQGLSRKDFLIFWLLIFLILFLFTKYFINLSKEKLLYISPVFLIFFVAQDYGRWFLLIFLTFLILSDKPNSNKNLITTITFIIILISGMIFDLPVYLFQDISIFKY